MIYPNDKVEVVIPDTTLTLASEFPSVSSDLSINSLYIAFQCV